MPNIGDISREISVASYQSFDGLNQTIGMYGLKYQAGENVSVYVGAGFDTNFTDNLGVVCDAKTNWQINENYSLQGRIRTCHSDKKNTTQFRISPQFQESLGKNTSVYVNPYYAYKLDYDNHTGNHSIGIFSGVSQKIGNKTTVFVEAQRYNLQDIQNNSGKNWSVNVGLSYKF